MWIATLAAAVVFANHGPCPVPVARGGEENTGSTEVEGAKAKPPDLRPWLDADWNKIVKLRESAKPAPPGVLSTPGEGTPAAGTPAAGTPAAGTPAAGTPATGTPAPSKEPEESEEPHEQRIAAYERNLPYFDDVVQGARWAQLPLEHDVLMREFSVDAPRQSYSRGRFSWQLLAGAELNSSDAFSEISEYVRFLGDTAWAGGTSGAGRAAKLHGIVDFALSTIPVEASSMDDMSGSSFIDEQKAFTGSVGLDWVPLRLGPSWDGHMSELGVAVRGGLQIIDDESTTAATNNEFWAAGFTFRTVPQYRYSDPNPVPYAFATLMYGDYDSLNDHVLTFDGLIRFVPDNAGPKTEDNAWGFFVGARAIVDFDDGGDDDLRLSFGFQDGFALLEDLFSIPKTLFGEE